MQPEGQCFLKPAPELRHSKSRITEPLFSLLNKVYEDKWVCLTCVLDFQTLKASWNLQRALMGNGLIADDGNVAFEGTPGCVQWDALS